MCNRHVAHLIADYEAARLDGRGDEEGAEDDARDGSAAREEAGEGGTLRAEPRDRERPGVLATVSALLGR
ncbi:MAG: hypothetical protein ABEJ81_00365 [Haloferacaceae archaeon]